MLLYRGKKKLNVQKHNGFAFVCGSRGVIAVKTNC